MSATPSGVSVIIPAYYSSGTLRRCLDSLRSQSVPAMEVFVVDSSPPEGSCNDIVPDYPEVNFIFWSGRLLPHEGRNVGIERSIGDLCVFTDPDIVLEPDWLERLLERHAETMLPVAGAMVCEDPTWRSTGMHLGKFDLWLPRSGVNELDVGLTGNLLVRRENVDRTGGFPSGMLGDTTLSWLLRRSGQRIMFAPRARARHIHEGTIAGFLKERFTRGYEFGELRSTWAAWTVWKIILVLAVSAMQLRTVGLSLRTCRNALASGMITEALLTSPIYIAGHAAWTLGESAFYVDRIMGRRAPSGAGMSAEGRDRSDDRVGGAE